MSFRLHDFEGNAVAYSDDGVNIFLFDGRPVAYLEQAALYAFQGEHLAHLHQGWVLDHRGFALFSTTHPLGPGPRPPLPRPPLRRESQLSLPQKWVRWQLRVTPVPQLRWSPQSGLEFFAARP